MNPLHQLTRRPVKAAFGVLLLALAGAILCLSGGQYWAAAQTRAAGQAQNGPGQGQQQNAEGRLHWPPGQLVQRVHGRDSFLQNRLLMLNYTDSLS